MSPKPSTFSIVASDPSAGEIGIAVQSKFLAVGSVVSHARGGIGAVATQANLNFLHGSYGLDLLGSAGFSPEEVIESLLKGDEQRNTRQLGLVDASGRSASFTGPDCFPFAASITGSNYACQGNILASAEVVPAMASAFESSKGFLAGRMIEALRAGQRAGGDRRGMESAHLYIVKPGYGYGKNHDRYIDLRVDHHPKPIEELTKLLELHHLYFERPKKEELIQIGTELEEEIRESLIILGRWTSGEDLMQALADYMSWENLEERWVGQEYIDQKILMYLRDHVHDTLSKPKVESIR